MTITRVIALLTVAALTIAASILYWVGLPPAPSVDELPALPWIEGVTTERIEGNVDNINSDDIYYATPKGVWQQAACEEVTVPLPDPDRPPEGPISFPGGEIATEVESYVQIDSHGTSTFNRCVCSYKVEWACTRVSRYITATATINGQTFVRYLYDRKQWDEDKTLRRRLNALVVTCSIDSDCDFYCGASTPPNSEWGIQCEGVIPHRILPPPAAF